MYNYKIDTTMLPTVYVTWVSTKNRKFNKRYWLNCATGEKKDEPEDWMYYPDETAINNPPYNQDGKIGLTYRTQKDDKIWVKNGSSVKFAYAKYHEDVDMLEVAAIGVDTTREAAVHEWKYLGDRFFIKRDKTIVNQHGNMCNSYYVFEGHTAWNGSVLLSMLYRLYYNDKILNEFKKFIGGDSFTIGSGRCITVTYFWHIQEWYKTSQKARGKGKEQKLADELTAIQLKDASNFGSKYPITEISDPRNRYGYYYNYKIYNVAYYEKVNNEWSVLRLFNRYGTTELKEAYRMYIHKNGKCRYVSKNSSDEWVPARTTQFGYGNYIRLVNKDEAIAECPRIKYASNAVGTDIEEYNFVNYLLAALRYPEIEQLSKLNCSDAAQRMMCNVYPKATIKEWFGGYYNEKEKNVLGKVGLTKQQLDYYAGCRADNSNSFRHSYQAALSEMREIFGKNLSHLDINSFKRYLDGLAHIKYYSWYRLERMMDQLNLDRMRYIKNLIRIGEKNEAAYQLANDAFGAANNLDYGTMPEVNWYFDSYSDIVRLHDALVALRNEQIAERQARINMAEAERLKKEEEKRIKLDKERAKYEYEDDNYIIRLPKDSSEIIREGSMQHICIGGYTSRHATGSTNLFFLRKKSDPTIPFYAIEMNTFNQIVQIHGFGNKWLGNNPEAIPTVVKWLRKNGIKCDEKILTCTATGYGSNGHYITMPIVD